MPKTQPAVVNQRAIDLMCCPRSGQSLTLVGNELVSVDERFSYPVTETGIPQMFVLEGENESRTEEVTERVKSFYEDTPFPNYDDVDDIRSLSEKAKRSVYVRLLDEQLPVNTKVLEVGCGTGQLSNFLSIPNRLVVGADICMNSLNLGREFSRANGLKNVTFVQMNLFHWAFKAESFDTVICTGVLHHTADPVGGFRSILRLLRVGGYIVIGLYNAWGRLFHDLRRVIFRISTGERIRTLDPYILSGDGSDRQRVAWFQDQYKHPHELTHTYG